MFYLVRATLTDTKLHAGDARQSIHAYHCIAFESGIREGTRQEM